MRKVTLGSFCLIKNEKTFIKAHLDSWLPHLDCMTFWDGNSTDGTLEVIKETMLGEFGYKIKLREDKDPCNLTSDYIRLSNNAMWDVDCDLAMFLHPDMFLASNGIKQFPEGCIAAKTHIKSYAGEPDGTIYEIKGRGEYWKNIYRLRNPDLGAHYFGSYGAHNEDTYFSEITGESHNHYGQQFDKYPYPVDDSGIEIYHYSDVRTYERRLERMRRCMIAQGMTENEANKTAPLHPRVSFENKNGFIFTAIETPCFLK